MTQPAPPETQQQNPADFARVRRPYLGETPAPAPVQPAAPVKSKEE